MGLSLSSVIALPLVWWLYTLRNRDGVTYLAVEDLIQNTLTEECRTKEKDRVSQNASWDDLASSGPQYFSRFGFLITGYNDLYCGWEITVFARKALLVALLGVNMGLLGGLLGLFVSGALIVLQVTYKPMSAPALHRYELGSLICLSVMYLGFTMIDIQEDIGILVGALAVHGFLIYSIVELIIWLTGCCDKAAEEVELETEK